MANNVYDVGDQIRCSVEFADADGNASDPTTITFKVEGPDESETTYVYGTDAEVVKDSVGNYRVDIDVDAAGYWYYRWEGTGNVVAAGENAFTVRESRF